MSKTAGEHDMRAPDSEAKPFDHAFLTAYGTFDTHKNATNPYKSITIKDIAALVSKPQAKNKEDAQFFIPSTYCGADGRTHDVQVERGMFHISAIDIDEGSPSLDKVIAAVEAVYGKVSFVVYSSSSASQKNMKWRVLVLIADGVPGCDYHDFQKATFALLADQDIKCDPALARPGQPVYLPNVGAKYREGGKSDGKPLFYEREIAARSGNRFHATGSAVEAQMLKQRERDRLATQKALKEAKRKAAERANKFSATGALPSIIDAFNANHSVEEMLLEYGYLRKGGTDSWRSPLQKSPTYATRNYGDHWTSLSGSDAGVGLGAATKSGAQYGDAWDLFCHFQHGSNFKAAAKDAAQSITLDDGRTYAEADRAAFCANIEQQPPDTPHFEVPPYMASEPPTIIWPMLGDPFAEHPVPPFPLEVLPEPLTAWCQSKAQQSGFDVGGYAFSMLVTAANTIDHRIKLNIGPFKTPSFLWGGLVGRSGSGKTPVMREAKFAAEIIHERAQRISKEKNAEWQRACVECKNNKEKASPPDRPTWKQRHALDATTEALAKLLADNPEGVNLYHDEITEFIGRMDVYSGKDAGKDRGVFLRAFDGGTVTINRAGNASPMVVEDFSIGILAGIQPEVLAERFNRAGSGSDGLYQRFLMYCLQPAGETSYTLISDPELDDAVQQIFENLSSLGDHRGKPFTVSLSTGATKLMEKFHNNVRVLASRTPAPRLGEHLDKYPGFLGRIALTLHLLTATTGDTDPLVMVSQDTMLKALHLMAVLLRHSGAVYELLDRGPGSVRKLVQSASEAILSKRWENFIWGDLTRNATNWRSSDARDAESAIDSLIEMGWIRDITPPVHPGKRGRRSSGKFLVNPDVHARFVVQADQIRNLRAERHKAITEITANKLN